MSRRSICALYLVVPEKKIYKINFYNINTLKFFYIGSSLITLNINIIFFAFFYNPIFDFLYKSFIYLTIPIHNRSTHNLSHTKQSTDLDNIHFRDRNVSSLNRDVYLTHLQPRWYTPMVLSLSIANNRILLTVPSRRWWYDMRFVFSSRNIHLFGYITKIFGRREIAVRTWCCVEVDGYFWIFNGILVRDLSPGLSSYVSLGSFRGLLLRRSYAFSCVAKNTWRSYRRESLVCIHLLWMACWMLFLRVWKIACINFARVKVFNCRFDALFYFFLDVSFVF